MASQQVRKPYTITKQRERWSDEEHQKFLESLKLYGRQWRKIEEYIGTKTAVQIRSHAQKFFDKRQRFGNGEVIEIPPPRPKRKPSHPYPKKATLTKLSSSSSPDIDNNIPSLQVKKSQPVITCLKLFGKTVVVDRFDDTEEEEEEEPTTTLTVEQSSTESDITNLSPQVEVTSREDNSSSMEYSSSVHTQHHQTVKQVIAHYLTGYQEEQPVTLSAWQLIDSQNLKDSLLRIRVQQDGTDRTPCGFVPYTRPVTCQHR